MTRRRRLRRIVLPILLAAALLPLWWFILSTPALREMQADPLVEDRVVRHATLYSEYDEPVYRGPRDWLFGGPISSFVGRSYRPHEDATPEEVVNDLQAKAIEAGWTITADEPLDVEGHKTMSFGTANLSIHRTGGPNGISLVHVSIEPERSGI